MSHNLALSKELNAVSTDFVITRDYTVQYCAHTEQSPEFPSNCQLPDPWFQDFKACSEAHASLRCLSDGLTNHRGTLLPGAQLQSMKLRHRIPERLTSCCSGAGRTACCHHCQSWFSIAEAAEAADAARPMRDREGFVALK